MMKRDPTSNDYTIVDCKITITWSDGITEDISADLPQYLGEEIEIYLDELDDLRSSEPEAYNFSEATEWLN